MNHRSKERVPLVMVGPSWPYRFNPLTDEHEPIRPEQARGLAVIVGTAAALASVVLLVAVARGYDTPRAGAREWLELPLPQRGVTDPPPTRANEATIVRPAAYSAFHRPARGEATPRAATAPTAACAAVASTIQGRSATADPVH